MKELVRRRRPSWATVAAVAYAVLFTVLAVGVASIARPASWNAYACDGFVCYDPMLENPPLMGRELSPAQSSSGTPTMITTTTTAVGG